MSDDELEEVQYAKVRLKFRMLVCGHWGAVLEEGAPRPTNLQVLMDSKALSHP